MSAELVAGASGPTGFDLQAVNRALARYENAQRIYSRDPDSLDRSSHRSAESLGLYGYNPATVVV